MVCLHLQYARSRALPLNELQPLIIIFHKLCKNDISLEYMKQFIILVLLVVVLSSCRDRFDIFMNSLQQHKSILQMFDHYFRANIKGKAIGPKNNICDEWRKFYRSHFGLEAWIKLILSYFYLPNILYIIYKS